MHSPCTARRRASGSSRSAMGLTSVSFATPKLCMTRATAPMLPAKCGRTRTTRRSGMEKRLATEVTENTESKTRKSLSYSLCSLWLIFLLRQLQCDLLDPLQIELPGPQDGQLGNLEEVALLGQPEVR